MQQAVVVVSRPAAQARELLAWLNEHHIKSVHQPSLKIQAVEKPDTFIQPFQALKSQAAASIFTSINAAEQAAKLVNLKDWTIGKRVFAVGQATAQYLSELNIGPVLIPEGKQTSEGLLKHPLLQPEQASLVCVVNAQGGRQLLQETLKLRGFSVKECHSYQRCAVKQASNAWLELIASSTPMITTVTSSAILESLLNLAPETNQKKLLNSPLIVISERMFNTAQTLGFKQIHQAENASNRALLNSILKRV